MGSREGSPDLKCMPRIEHNTRRNKTNKNKLQLVGSGFPTKHETFKDEKGFREHQA